MFPYTKYLATLKAVDNYVCARVLSNNETNQTSAESAIF